MSDGGMAVIGMGESDTENRSIEVVEKALSNPLLSADIDGANGALINVMGGPDITIKEARDIVESVATRLSPDAKVIWGAQIDKNLKDAIRTLIIITGVTFPEIGEISKPLLPRKKLEKDIEKILGIEFVE